MNRAIQGRSPTDLIGPNFRHPKAMGLQTRVESVLGHLPKVRCETEALQITLLLVVEIGHHATRFAEVWNDRCVCAASVAWTTDGDQKGTKTKMKRDHEPCLGWKWASTPLRTKNNSGSRFGSPMSASGQKRTSSSAPSKSALLSKADSEFGLLISLLQIALSRREFAA